MLHREVQAPDDWVSPLLHTFHKRPGPRSSYSGVHLVPAGADKDQRPVAVETRKFFGHWKRDSIVGAIHRGAIATLVERQTRVLVSRTVRHRTNHTFANVISVMMTYRMDIVNIVTFDNGGKLAYHARSATALNCQAYVAKPRHACELGTNENHNGELRHDYTKQKPLDNMDRTDLAETNAAINSRHHKIVSYDTAAERYAHSPTFNSTQIVPVPVIFSVLLIATDDIHISSSRIKCNDTPTHSNHLEKP